MEVKQGNAVAEDNGIPSTNELVGILPKRL